MFKRTALLIIAIVLLLGVFSPFAIADSSIPQELLEQAEKAGINTDGLTILEIKTKLSEIINAEKIAKSNDAGTNTDGLNPEKAKPVFTGINEDNSVNPVIVNPEVKERAEQLGIDTNGLTTIQIKIKITAAINAEYREKAKNYGIDTTNLTDEQVRDRVLTIENAAVIAKAKNAGINTDGLTYYQVMESIAQRDRENAIRREEQAREEAKKVVLEMANRYGIDTTGLTYEQIKVLVDEKMMPELISIAQGLGIDYQGLSYDELLRRVKEKQIEGMMNGTGTK